MRIVLVSYNLEDAERTVIISALQGSYTGTAGAAEALGVSLKRLEHLIKHHDIRFQARTDKRPPR